MFRFTGAGIVLPKLTENEWFCPEKQKNVPK